MEGFALLAIPILNIFVGVFVFGRDEFDCGFIENQKAIL